MNAVHVASVSDVPEGSGKTFEVNDRKIAIFHVGDNFYALDDTCSHEHASLGEGDIDEDDRNVACPKHGALFDLVTGHPRTLPAYQPVAIYPVRVEHDRVVVELPE